MSTPITLTGGSITTQGSGSEAVTTLKTNGNFAALVLNSDHNVIRGFWITANGSHAGSSQHGLVINGYFNTIDHNSLSSLGGNGVYLTGNFNVITANLIGVQTLGGTQWAVCNYANDQWGIELNDANNNTISANTSGCNGQDGIGIHHNSYNNTITDNYIGVVNWGGRVPNQLAGVALWGGAHHNLIGRTDYGNVSGANGTFGIYLGDSATATNTVQLNSIGISGSLNISNTLDGVAIVGGAHVNRVYTNTIEDNGHNGVWLSGAGTINNVLQANMIRRNSLAGVAIQNGASGNSIGPGPIALGNTISANAFDGVYISDNTTLYNSVSGNAIGTNWMRTAVDPNGGNGVVLDNGTSGNAVGWSYVERNVIAGNNGNGVLIQNGAHDNWVRSNDIGTNRDMPVAALSNTPHLPTGGGTDYAALPNSGGITIYNAYTNTIGGSGYYNLIGHNIHTGVYLSCGSHGNLIGSNLVRNSGDYGVLFDGGNTAYNTITRTEIFSNGLDGIGERNGAGFNVWSEVGIHDNGGLGVDKSVNNDGQNIVNAPTLTFDSINKQTGVVQGHADPSVLGTVIVELYRVAPDPSGFGEGGVFVGKATTAVNGSWTITDTSPLAVRGCYTAFVTESQLVIPFSSSEFSANTCRTFLPLTVKQ